MATLLSLKSLSMRFGERVLFDDLTTTIDDGAHIALIGRNGAGKSTLCKIIAGELPQDDGEVIVHDGTRIGYLRQHDEQLDPTHTVMEYLERSSQQPSWTCAKEAAKFGFTPEMLEQPIGDYSGGYQMRMKLVALLLHEPNLLLLDEPTNYLDLSTVLLLEEWLLNYSGTFVLVSHDRDFLNKVCTSTLAIEAGQARYYPGDVDAYFVKKAEEREFAKRYNKKIAAQERHLQAFVDRFRYKASKASAAQSKLKQIEKLEYMELGEDPKHARITIPEGTGKAGCALAVEELVIGYPDYTVAQDISFTINRGQHIAILGDNGQGKSTLLKTLMGKLSPKSGSAEWRRSPSIGYYDQHVARAVSGHHTVIEHLTRQAPQASEETLLNMAGDFLFWDTDLMKSIDVLSGGEKARLSLASLLLKKHEILLLDEPTNHLDFETVEALANGLAQARNTTILFVSHNRRFIHTVAEEIIEVGDGTAKKFMHDYDNYLYHLKSRLAIKSDKPDEHDHVPTEDNTAKERRSELYSLIKTKQAAITRLEGIIEKQATKKQRLMDWFAKHPTEFNQNKIDALTAINTEIEITESEWEKESDELTAMMNELDTLR